MTVAQSHQTIGRDESCDLRLDNPNVSRHHAEYWPASRVLRDLGSTNGTKVNGRLITQTTVAPGDDIRIGPFDLDVSGGLLVLSRPDVPAAPPSVLLRVRDVEFAVGGVRRLHAMSFDVRAGELTAVIGPSGCGKSTLLKLLAGVHRPSNGTIELGGEPAVERLWDVGYVPQHDTLHRFVTARESVRFAGRLRLPADTTNDELAALASDALTSLQIGDRADRAPGEISGGERKRLGVAIELVAHPSLVLLDEPTSGLDPNVDHQLMEHFHAMARRGQAVVVVTHNTKALHDLCDRLIVLDKGGHLAFAGTFSEALATFGVLDIDKAYDVLDGRGNWPPQGVVTASAPVAPGARRQRRISRTSEIATIARRTALNTFRDAGNLRWLTLPIPILGVILALLFGRDVFSEEAEATKSAQFLFAMVLIVSMFGASGGLRAFLRDRGAIQRETGAGVRLQSQLLGKGLVHGAVAVAQVVALAGVTFALAPLHASGPRYAELLIVLVLAGLTALSTGFLISAWSRTEAQAVTLLNFVLVPQLLFAGAIVALHDMGPVRPAAALLSARWAYAAAGSTVDLSARAGDDRGFLHFYGRDFFDLSWVAAAAILIAMIVALSAASIWTLRRRLHED